ncbi:MAG: energy transducer TonB [Lysobacter sp.]|nr:energy transducer TonB [Lysobacter sp.]
MKDMSRSGLALLLAAAIVAPSAHAESERTVNEGGIRDQWLIADGVTLGAPGYPAAFAARGDNVCTAISYRISPDGTTSDFALVRAWASSGSDTQEQGFWKAFAEASALALAQWKFKPRPEVKDPVTTHTVATMTFMGKHAEDVAVLRSRCKIDDLATTLREIKRNPARNELNHVQMDAAQRAQRANEIRANQRARGN